MLETPFAIPLLICSTLFIPGLIILSVLIILRKKRKKQYGENITPSKLRARLSNAVIITCIIIIAIPLLSLSNQIASNTHLLSIDKKIVFAKSGEMLLWSQYDDEKQYIFNEKTFKDIAWHLDMIWNFDIDPDNYSMPIANIKPDLSNRTFSQKYFWFVQNLVGDGNAFGLLGRNISTIYPVENDSGTELHAIFNGFNKVTDEDSYPNGVYCISEESSSVNNYYSDIKNYNTSNLTFKYEVYDENHTTEYDFSKYDDIVLLSVDTNLDPDIFREVWMCNMALKKMNPNPEAGIFHDKEYRVDIPKEYIDIYNAENPGSSPYGYLAGELYAYSKDKVTSMHIPIFLIGDKVYITESYNNIDYLFGLPLSDDISKSLIKNIFSKIN